MKNKLIGALLVGATLIGFANSSDGNKAVQQSIASPVSFSATVETTQTDNSVTTLDTAEGFIELSPSPIPSPTPKPTVKPTPVPTPKLVVVSTPKPTPTPAPVVTSDGFSCNCSKTCPNMSSCEEAQYQLNVCGCGARDADNDGIACDADCQ